MVHYQGPALLQAICDRFEIPIFDRIIGLTFKVDDFSDISISKKQLAQLAHLKSVSLQPWGLGTWQPKSVPVAEVEGIIEPCRVANVTEEDHEVVVSLTSQSLACCSK